MVVSVVRELQRRLQPPAPARNPGLNAGVEDPQPILAESAGCINCLSLGLKNISGMWRIEMIFDFDIVCIYRIII